MSNLPDPSVTRDQVNASPPEPVAPPPNQGTPAPAPPAPARKPRFSRDVVLVVLALLLAAGGIGAYAWFGFNVKNVDFSKAFKHSINPDKLDPQFIDADDDLVADVPTSSKKQIDPETLYLATLDSDNQMVERKWKEFIEHLKEVTGKEVELVEPLAGGLGLVEAMKNGSVHIAQASTGAVPLAVNRAGFVPCVVPANEKGKFAYQMELLVPADSDIKELKDLKGRKLTLASMSSLSSFKAPLVVLFEKTGLLPGRDYEISISNGQFASIRGVAGLKKGSKKPASSTTFEAVAVANDLIPQAIAEHDLDKDSFRSIYKSESYPPFCIGHVHNLKPALAAKIRKALETFKFEGTALGQKLAAAGQTRFVRINYKKDWESVRTVERTLAELVDKYSGK